MDKDKNEIKKLAKSFNYAINLFFIVCGSVLIALEFGSAGIGIGFIALALCNE